ACPAAAVENQPTAIEHADADAGTTAAPEPNGIAGKIERQIVQATQPRRDRESELRSGPEPGVRGHRLLDPRRIGAFEVQVPPHRLDMLRDARALPALHLRRGREANVDPGPQFGNRHPDAGKTPAQTSARIEKPKCSRAGAVTVTLAALGAGLSAKAFSRCSSAKRFLIG